MYHERQEKKFGSKKHADSTDALISSSYFKSLVVNVWTTNCVGMSCRDKVTKKRLETRDTQHKNLLSRQNPTK